MRKLLVLAIVLPLAGCFGIPDKINVQTAVSQNTLYGLVNSYGIALSGENTYKALCASGSLPKTCRDVVARLQKADAVAVKSLEAANNFIKQYPTVDPANFLSAAREAVNNFNAIVSGAN